MDKKSFTQKILHTVFKFLPQNGVCIFGTCKQACTALAMKEEIDSEESVRLRCHLMVCYKCWNYYQQMKIINRKIIYNLNGQFKSKKSIEAKPDVIQGLIKEYSNIKG